MSEGGRGTAWVRDTRFEVGRGEDAEVGNEASHDIEL